MREEKRKTGIDIIGDAPWGTHFCQFYQTKQDLIDILVPYFKAGLENNEFCMWVTSEPLGEEEAKQAMQEAISDFDRYLTRGQIEIVPYTQWYLKDGHFDLQRVLNSWITKYNLALDNGYDGLRITGNAAWLEKRDWKNFADYEEEIDSVIDKYRMIAICTYCLEKCGASEIIDVVRNHQFALIKREGKWALIESSERKRVDQAVHEAREYAESIVATVREPLVVLDDTLKVVSANRSFYQTFKVTPEETEGRFLYDLGNRQWDIPELRQLLEDILPKKIAFDDFEVEHNFPQIGKRVMLLNAREVLREANKPQLILLAIQDITERKRMEEEIKRKNKELENFVYMVSHDLKNPVVSIQGFCSLLMKKHKQDLSEKILFYLKRVQANASLMANLLEDLVELSRIGRIKEKKREVSVREVIESVWSGVSRALSTEEVEFICPENLPKVFYSEQRLYQIFFNLLSNAFKFKSKNKVLKVQIGFEYNEDDYTFFVRDNGIGIEEKYHDKIFEFFSQLKENKTEGTGMGLATVKKIVEANQGRVWVESQKGKGSTFYFTIPKNVQT